MSDFERHFKLKTHLKVIGTILESSKFYSNRRKEMFENLVLKTIQLISQKNELPTIGKIQKVLQYEKTPLVNRNKLIGILKNLEKKEVISCSKINGKDIYEYSKSEGIPNCLIRKSLRHCYQRYVSNLNDRYFDLFQEILVEAFSDLGINTVNQLFIKKLSYTSSIEEIIESKSSLIDKKDYADFKEGVLSFFESDSEEAKKLKIALAQAYTALKMMGAGNWQDGELDKILNNKSLILDSNVFFSIISAQKEKKNPVLNALIILKSKHDVNFSIANETKAEFFRAITHQLEELRRIYQKEININALHENEMFDIEWFSLFKDFTDGKCPIDEIENFYKYLEQLVEGIIIDLQCEIIHIDLIDIENNASPKEEQISKLIKKKGRNPKSTQALKHDSLIWEHLEDNPAKRFFTYDSIWRFIKINDSSKSINAGDLFLYITIGTIESTKFSQLLNHVIKNNLLTNNNYFSLDEISSLGNAEEKVLALPRSKRRELISKIHDLRKEKFEQGKEFVSDEVSALAFSYLINVENNVTESNQIKYLESQLKEKTEKLKLSDNQKTNLKLELDETSQKANRFKSDKLNLALSILSLILVSVGAHFIHRLYDIPWLILSIPLTMMLLSTLIGYFKGFKRGWTVSATVFSLILSYATFIFRTKESKIKIAKENTDVVSEKRSGVKKVKLINRTR